jgi:hypothetical protein
MNPKKKSTAETISVSITLGLVLLGALLTAIIGNRYEK